MSQAAERMKPDDAGPNAQARKLVQYHLIVAAKHTREIAEALAKQKSQS
jgi:hypothetical protein